ncbi:hypothetical protein [Polaromonas sp. CF318]|nr:hypothetical protein [Polaromonas sp. CF318]
MKKAARRESGCLVLRIVGFVFICGNLRHLRIKFFLYPQMTQISAD